MGETERVPTPCQKMTSTVPGRGVVARNDP
jgi:hypothetical protein